MNADIGSGGGALSGHEPAGGVRPAEGSLLVTATSRVRRRMGTAPTAATSSRQQREGAATTTTVRTVAQKRPSRVAKGRSPGEEMGGGRTADGSGTMLLLLRRGHR